MKLLPREKDKLLIAMAAQVAHRRLQRGVKLNYPEAVAYISDFIIEAARDGKSVAALMRDGLQVLRADQVMEGVPELIAEVQVEATFPDGTKLVTVHNPIRSTKKATTIPGEILVADGEDIAINCGRKSLSVDVENTGDRPIQVGSHFHFFESNPALQFERARAYGCRLNIAAGSGVRFEPGQKKSVQLVAFSGARRVFGFSQQVQGDLAQ